MTTAEQPRPTDPAWPGLGLDDLSFTVDEGYPGEVQDAATKTRGQAIAYFAREADVTFTEVRCGVRYVHLFSRQEVWDGPGRDRWFDDWEAQFMTEHQRWPTQAEREAAQVPAEPPSDWRPDEYMPCWQFVKKDHPQARRAWCCEIKGQERVLA